MGGVCALLPVDGDGRGAQTRLGGRAISALHRVPALAYGIPFLILPTIAWRLVTAPRGYLPTFLALLPFCVVGHFMWANTFRNVLDQMRMRSRTDW